MNVNDLTFYAFLNRRRPDGRQDAVPIIVAAGMFVALWPFLLHAFLLTWYRRGLRFTIDYVVG